MTQSSHLSGTHFTHSAISPALLYFRLKSLHIWLTPLGVCSETSRVIAWGWLGASTLPGEGGHQTGWLFGVKL